MEPIKNILVASDFSAPADAAMQNALILAKIFNTSITLLHVVTLFAESDIEEKQISTLNALFGHLERKASQKIDACLAGIHSEGVKVDATVRSGFNVAEEILTFIKKNDIGLVAIGSHGHKPLSQWILGSVADKVTKMAACPVLAVRQGSKNRDSLKYYNRLLVGSDFSPNSKKALEMAAALASAKTQIDLLHVIDDSFLAHYGTSGMASLMPVLQHRASETLAHFAQDVLPEKINCSRVLEIGPVSDKIIEYAHNHHADMIIIGQRSRFTDEPIMLGSVSDHLVRQSKIPVLVVK